MFKLLNIAYIYLPIQYLTYTNWIKNKFTIPIFNTVQGQSDNF